jgi:hypothetical protein
MITALAIMFMAALFGLGARPIRRESRYSVLKQETVSASRSGTQSGLYGDAPDLTKEAFEVTGGNRLMSLTPAMRRYVDAVRKTDPQTWSENGSDFKFETVPAKTLPPCFVCGTTLSRPYPDRDYFCDHCQKFISMGSTRR